MMTAPVWGWEWDEFKWQLWRPSYSRGEGWRSLVKRSHDPDTSCNVCGYFVAHEPKFSFRCGDHDGSGWVCNGCVIRLRLDGRKQGVSIG